MLDAEGGHAVVLALSHHLLQVVLVLYTPGVKTGYDVCTRGGPQAEF